MASGKRGVLGVVVALGFVLGLSDLAFATPILRLSDGTTTVTIADGSLVPLDGDGTAGKVSWTGVVGAWIVNITAGNTTAGTPTNPKLTLTSVDVSSSIGSAPPPLTISFTETGFVGAPLMAFQNSIGGTTLGTVTYSTYLDNANMAFGLGTLIDTPGITGVLPAFSGSGGALKSPAGTYSLTTVVMMTHSAGPGVISSFTAELTGNPVPEPSSLLLLGSGLIWACRYGRRKRG